MTKNYDERKVKTKTVPGRLASEEDLPKLAAGQAVSNDDAVVAMRQNHGNALVHPEYITPAHIAN